MLLLVLVLLAAGSPGLACSESFLQWSCYTVQPGDFLFAVAQKLGVNPNKLCDYNNATLLSLGGDCNHLQAGYQLRVPLDQCTPTSAYDCHTIITPNMSVAVLAESIYKMNSDVLFKLNADVLYGDKFVYLGMQIRIPVFTCTPSVSTACYVAQAGDDLYSMASKFAVNAGSLFYANFDRINPLHAITLGRVYVVPLDCSNQPGQYFCYKVRSGDTVNALGSRFGIDPNVLCKYNQLSNCSQIRTEDFALKIPIHI
eukprot:m.51957 g.51957  ORF g.51957 m.51957 type:complete len:256 (+) comp15282_c0_seq1:65-832(+)